MATAEEILRQYRSSDRSRKEHMWMQYIELRHVFDRIDQQERPWCSLPHTRYQGLPRRCPSPDPEGKR